MEHDLFGYPSTPGYVAGCDTSRDAAESMDGTAASLRAKIYRYIEKQPQGATCDEVEEALKMRHQTASARIRELVMDRRIFDCGDRRLTRSRRSARVYCVLEQSGRAMIRHCP